MEIIIQLGLYFIFLLVITFLTVKILSQRKELKHKNETLLDVWVSEHEKSIKIKELEKRVKYFEERFDKIKLERYDKKN